MNPRALAIVTACFALARDARAQEVDAPRPARVGPPAFELGGTAGYSSAPIRGGTNPFGVGLGARLGMNIGHVYLGGAFTGYQGDTDVDTTEQATLVGGELGYSVRVALFEEGWLTVRPQLGAGVVTITRVDPPAPVPARGGTAPRVVVPDVITQATRAGSSTSTVSLPSSTTTSLSNLYVQPGLTAILSSGVLFAGVNGNVLVVPAISYDGDATTWIAYGLQGQVGVCW